MTTQPLENKFSNMSINTTDNNNNSKKEESNDQPLKRSAYNIFDAYDSNIPHESSLLLDSSAVHPLQKTSEAYSMDIAPNQEQHQGELNNMMQDLSIAPNSANKSSYRQRSMPYCV